MYLNYNTFITNGQKCMFYFLIFLYKIFNQFDPIDLQVSYTIILKYAWEKICNLTGFI